MIRVTSTMTTAAVPDDYQYSISCQRDAQTLNFIVI